MSDEFQDDVDLFGDPCRLSSGRRGRPAHRYAQEIADKITLGLAAGWSNQRIANGVGISVPTLKRYYFSLLQLREIQRDRLDLWRFHKLQKLASDGNVTAMKELGVLIEKNDRMSIAKRMQDEEDDLPEETRETLGKKEQAKKAAEKAVSEPSSKYAPGYGLN